MKLKGRRVAILAEKFYEDQELWYPLLRLKEEGAEVRVVAPRTDTVYESKHGYPVKADVPSSEARAADFDAVIVPGGYAPDHMRRDPKMVAFLADANRGGKIIAAICHAGWMLASADAVRGKNVTGFFSIKDDLVNAGATWQDKEVVVDGNLITSRTPADLPAFSRAVIEALAKAPVGA